MFSNYPVSYKQKLDRSLIIYHLLKEAEAKENGKLLTDNGLAIRSV